MRGPERRGVIPSPAPAAPTALLAAAALCTVAALFAAAAPSAASLSDVPPPAIEWAPRSYVCHRAGGPIRIDGSLDERDWAAAPRTEPFVDILGPGGQRPRFTTRARMLWDERFLYVAAEMEEPDLWATLTERDAVIYHDNDFEVFIDPDGDTHEYYELEINALGAVWDLLLVRPYRDGGPAVDAWDIQGLEAAVSLGGTLNDPGDADQGWAVEMAIPWSVLDDCAHRPVPPGQGDRWRMNFSRVEWRHEVVDGLYAKKADPTTGRNLPEDNWVWSPQGLVAMHYPEMWGFVEFSETPAGSPSPDASTAASPPTPVERAAWDLRRVYYAERTAYARSGAFTDDVRALGIGGRSGEPGGAPAVAVTPRGFEAWVITTDGTRVWITEDGRVFTVRSSATD